MIGTPSPEVYGTPLYVDVLIDPNVYGGGVEGPTLFVRTASDSLSAISEVVGVGAGFIVRSATDSIASLTEAVTQTTTNTEQAPQIIIIV